jgi:predicted flap endonuclease-1-like 5' DNA nuclease
MSTGAMLMPLAPPSKALRGGRVERTDSSDPPVKIAKEVEALEESNQAPDRLSDNGDDFQQIKGIGQAVAQALNNVGIHHYTDLVKFTPDSLGDLLKAEIPSISPKRIEREDWIEQARVLIQPTVIERASPQENAEAAKGSSKASPPKKPPQYAGFTVFFDRMTDEHGKQVWQTRVYHDESGEETSFPGVETSLWVNWMLKQANLATSARPNSTDTKGLAPPTPVTPYDATIGILAVQVSKVRPSSAVPESRLVAEVHFQISGTEAEMLTAMRMPYRIEVHTVDLESGASKLVASEESHLRPGVVKYRSQQRFRIPDLGRYELHSIALLLPPGDMMAYCQGPTLKVIP